MQINEARIILAQLTSKSRINEKTIEGILNGVNGTTFASLTQVSRVKTSAKHKELEIYKITRQNITLCNSKSSLYVNAVSRETQSAFTELPAHYEMVNDSYSLVSLKSNPAKFYLRATINKCLERVYYNKLTDQMMPKLEVSQFLTKSAAKELMNMPRVNEIKHAGITHTVTIRMFALENIAFLNLNKVKLIA